MGPTMRTHDDDYPQVIVHSGDCGYCVSISFTTKEAHDPVAWALKMENLRHRLLAVEAGYKDDYGPDATVLQDGRYYHGATADPSSDE